jgi:hypothetical protein
MEFEILKRAASVFGVTDAVLVDGEDGFTFRQAGRVVDLADPLLAASFPEIQPKKYQHCLTNRRL